MAEETVSEQTGPSERTCNELGQRMQERTAELGKANERVFPSYGKTID